MRLINAVVLVVSLTLAVEAHACKRKWKNRDITPESDSNKSRPSLSAILFGQSGCELTCNILSQFYGSGVRPVAREMIFCDCNETFSVDGNQVDVKKFKTLPLNTLWDYWFEKSAESSSMLNRIQRNGRIRAVVLALMRNPHMTGDEVKQMIMLELPQLNQMARIPTVVHGDREDAVRSAADGDYNSLDRLFPDLFNSARSQVTGAPYETRLYNLLNRLSRDELDYVRNQLQKTGRESLVRMVTDYTSNNRLDDNDARQQRRGARRMPRRMAKNSSDERRIRLDDESDFDVLERELIEVKVVNELLDAVNGVQRARPSGGAANVSNRPLNLPSRTASNMPFMNSGFQANPFGNNLAETIRKNIQDNMEQMKKQAEQADENGAHTTYDFNSVSDQVVTTIVDGEQTRVEDAGVKKIHTDSDRPSDNMDKEFDLNAISLKNRAKNLDNRVIQTVDTDNIAGSSKIQERIKNGDKEFILFHDANERGAARGQPLNVANEDSLNDLKSSTYYVVLDEDGNIVHATNSDRARMLENDMSSMFQ